MQYPSEVFTLFLGFASFSVHGNKVLGYRQRWSIISIESGSESMAVKEIQSARYNPQSLGRMLGQITKYHNCASILEIQQVIVVTGNAFREDSDRTTILKVFPDTLIDHGMVNRIRELE